MNTHSTRHSLDRFGVQRHQSLLRKHHIWAIERICAIGAMSWFAGILFLAGWMWSTVGFVKYTDCIIAGLLFIVPAIAVTAVLKKAKIHPLHMPVEVGFALAFILIEASYFLGMMSGEIWNAIGGTHPF